MRSMAVAIAVSMAVLVTASCTSAEMEMVRAAVGERQASAQSVHLNSTLVCIRHHEWDRTAWPYDHGYRAENPVSTASGAYQFVDRTWRSESRAAGYAGTGHASAASVGVQDAVAFYAITHGGRSAWRGDGC
jgi:Transglycosylase-like domain